MNPREYYDKLIDGLPAGAERAVARIISYHIGLENAIKKDELIEECKRVGIHFSDERQARAVIVSLRKMGYLICSSSGNSGYFIAQSLSEYQEFRTREYIKKIKDMAETTRAMDTASQQIFSIEINAASGQPALFQQSEAVNV